MDLFDESPLFSFLYDGEKFCDLEFEKDIKAENAHPVTAFALSDGLRITTVAKKHEKYGVWEWVNYFENIGSKPSGIISRLWDCDIQIPLANNGYRRDPSCLPNKDLVTKIYAPSGSVWGDEEFFCNIERTRNNRFDFYLLPGERRQFGASGGRSSEANAPFFNIHRCGEGAIIALGWTGQWHTDFGCAEDHMEVKTGIEGLNFRLFPGEKIRTSSVFIMPYKGSVEDSQNLFRHFIKDEISPLYTSGHAHLPVSAMLWGGMPSEEMIQRIRRINEYDIPVDCIWVDAGWYGASEKECIDEFAGDWASFAGDWRVNKRIHPQGLSDVSKAAHDTGRKFLLWLEPERALAGTPISDEHPEYFFGSTVRLLNLGREDAWQYCFDMLCEKIEKLSLDCYRQDFNMSPLSYWCGYDAEDRKGISQIKHIMGLYKLWDALLNRFPNLLIDNCASGGRRIDMETLRRSVPLWRSDAMCPVDTKSETLQMHNMTYSCWLPYSGAAVGPQYDLYKIRSAYASGFSIKHAYTVKEPFNDPESLNFLSKCLKEYKILQPYFEEDFYALTEPSANSDVWAAWQFDRPCKCDGIVQVFRRENSHYSVAELSLHGIDKYAFYTFTDIDSGEEKRITGEELIANGFNVNIAKRRTAKIYIYKKQNIDK
ncbi:MAG: alpha-galactosidase [Clostridia bacterium]|nr:alpha-galactosidase [Clostridia bacterium]